MNTYLLTWNPKKWGEEWDLVADCEKVRRHGFLDDRWSCGTTKRIQPGDRVFLMRQGKEPRGIMAAGTAQSAYFEDKHWDETRDDQALYVEVRFDSLLHPVHDGVLSRADLRSKQYSDVNWDTQSSGILIPPEVAEKLEYRWNEFLEEIDQAPIILADEVVAPETYYEGASRRIFVNRYERDANARKSCIDFHGSICIACTFDFGKVYGDRGVGYIHVHHIVPLSEIKKGYQVNPQTDLVPLCPNCHAMIHRYPETLTIDQLRDLLS